MTAILKRLFSVLLMMVITLSLVSCSSDFFYDLGGSGFSSSESERSNPIQEMPEELAALLTPVIADFNQLCTENGMENNSAENYSLKSWGDGNSKAKYIDITYKVSSTDSICFSFFDESFSLISASYTGIYENADEKQINTLIPAALLCALEPDAAFADAARCVKNASVKAQENQPSYSGSEFFLDAYKVVVNINAKSAVMVDVFLGEG